MAFVGNTGVYYKEENSFEDFSIESGLNLEASTFFAASILGNLILQVTESNYSFDYYITISFLYIFIYFIKKVLLDFASHRLLGNLEFVLVITTW